MAIPEQTATGKEMTNPFMAGSLPKTISFDDSLSSDEDSFGLIWIDDSLYLFVYYGSLRQKDMVCREDKHWTLKCVDISSWWSS